MTDEELKEMAAHGNDVASELLQVRAAVRREREADVALLASYDITPVWDGRTARDATSIARKEQHAARALVDRLVAGEKEV